MINRHFVFPTYHLNGSAPEHHVTDTTKALYHLNAFEVSIRELRPHRRDRFDRPSPRGAYSVIDGFETAEAEFLALEVELITIRTELEAFRNHAQDVVDARFANRQRTV